MRMNYVCITPVACVTLWRGTQMEASFELSYRKISVYKSPYSVRNTLRVEIFQVYLDSFITAELNKI